MFIDIWIITEVDIAYEKIKNKTKGTAMERLAELNQAYDEALIALEAAQNLIKHIQEERYQAGRYQLYFAEGEQ